MNIIMARNISKLDFISNYITDQSLGFCEHIDVFLGFPKKHFFMKNFFNKNTYLQKVNLA